MRILILLAALLTTSLPARAAEPPSAMDRILASKEIRCGYNVYSPYLRKDANTGELSGIFYDVMAEIGKNAGLKITWAEEVGFSEIFTGLAADRYDVWCSGLWPNAARGLVGSFTHALFYSVMTPWVRAADIRFQTLTDLTKHNAKISVIDGAMESLVVAADYPNLPRLSMPASTAWSLNFENVMSSKADVAFAEPSATAEFLAKNPGKLRSLGAGNAIRTFANTLGVRLGDVKTQSFLNAASDELVYSGTIDRILTKYEPVPGAFPRVATPFKE